MTITTPGLKLKVKVERSVVRVEVEGSSFSVSVMKVVTAVRLTMTIR